MDNNGRKGLLVVPCSGIGKVHGLVSREAVYHVTDRLLPEQAETVCLALLVAGDPETRQKVQKMPCITLDGCPKLCAYKNVELSGGKITKGIRVHDVMKRHRGADFGTPTALSEAGWAVVEEVAGEVARISRDEAAT
jgi:uncharacterized metal-binding protein